VPPAVAAALRAARARGVDVRVVLVRSARAGRYGARRLPGRPASTSRSTRGTTIRAAFAIVDDNVALPTLSEGAAAHAETVNVFQRAPELAQSCAVVLASVPAGRRAVSGRGGLRGL
jgi:phosphatidylserine/phosphatidylglycerophosphate/cardiolipin synthase-like enzyme